MNSVNATRIVAFLYVRIASVLIVMRNGFAQMMMVVYFTTFVLYNSVCTFRLTIVATVEVNVHARTTVNNNGRKQ